MGSATASPLTFRRGAHAVTIVLLLAFSPVGNALSSSKAGPALAFAPTQRLASLAARSLVRVTSAAAGGVLSEVAGQALSGGSKLPPQLQPTLLSAGSIATAVAPVGALPMISTLTGAAAYRGTMALSYDSFLGSVRRSAKVRLSLPAVLLASAATGLASAAYVSATHYRETSPHFSQGTVCSMPFGARSKTVSETGAMICTEAVEYAAFFGLQHMVLSSLPYLAGTWYGCAVAGAGTGLSASVLGEVVRKRVLGGVNAARQVSKKDVATQNFVLVGVTSSIRLALKC